MSVAYVNGKEYTGANVDLRLFGKQISGLVSVSYGETSSFFKRKGASRLPVSYAVGNIDATVEIVLSSVEWDNIAKNIPTGKEITDFMFDLPVSYINANQLLCKDVVKNVVILGAKKDVTTESEDGVNVTLEVQCSNIEFNTN